MPVDLSQAELLKNWFTPVRDGEQGVDVADRLSNKPDIERISDLLAELWFSADYAWTGWYDTDILAILQQWLPLDSAEEMQFRQCAIPGKLTDLIAWLDPMILRWEAGEAEATADRGTENPEYARDPIAGTRYYRWVNGEYVYCDDQDAPYIPGSNTWLSLDARISAQDKAGPHYDPDSDRWRKPTGGGEYSYQNRETGQWEHYHSEAVGWLPYDQPSDTWLYQGQWRASHDIAAPPAPLPSARARVIPIHQIPGWEPLEREPWAKGWYARLSADAYSYLYSPSAVPTEDAPGWADVPPAPPIDGGDGSDQSPGLVAAVEQVCVDYVIPAVTAFLGESPNLEAASEDDLFEAFVEVLKELASEETSAS